VSAELVVRPGQEIPRWGDFVSTHPPFSIALDGYVIAPPEFTNTPDGPYANFDHHEGVPRMATLSTAQQVLRAIRLGIVHSYTQNRDYIPTVYTNDCDQDVALAWYLLQHAPDVAAQKYKKRAAPLRNLVEMAGDLDVTAGTYPYPPSVKLMKEVAWMFRPYTETRNHGGLRSMDADTYRQVIGECCGRIGMHLAGRGKEIRLDTRYETIGGGEGWSMITEVGPEGRIGAFNDGIKAYVIYKGQREDGRHDYTIGRASEFVPFDVQGIVDGLNGEENRPIGAAWGCAGSGTVGGSPRLQGSMLDPATLTTFINDRH
jgi:hypothetical protein